MLRPGGRLLITDYCRGAGGEPSEGFAAYIAQRGYDLHTLEVGAGCRGAGHRGGWAQVQWMLRAIVGSTTTHLPRRACCLQAYAAMLREAGFDGVAAFDRTEQARLGGGR